MKLCDTCIYRNNVELLKPCIVYRDDCEFYKKERGDMIDDLISRQAVYDLIRSLTRWCVRSEDGKFNNVGLLYDDVMFGVYRLPSVNPQEPKTGHWIDQYNDGNWHCSKCGAIVEKDEQINHNWYFCYHCGCRMVEPKESEGEE